MYYANQVVFDLDLQRPVSLAESNKGEQWAWNFPARSTAFCMEDDNGRIVTALPASVEEALEGMRLGTLFPRPVSARFAAQMVQSAKLRNEREKKKKKKKKKA